MRFTDYALRMISAALVEELRELPAEDGCRFCAPLDHLCFTCWEIRATNAIRKIAEEGRQNAGVKFVNLTPHPIRVLNPKGNLRASFEPSHTPARVDMGTKKVGHIGTVDIFESTFRSVTGLPEPEPDVLYIVSRTLAQQVPDRYDLVVPVKFRRDSDGNIIGCRGFEMNRRKR